MRAQPFQPEGGGGVRLGLSEPERALVAGLARELLALLEARPGDPSLRRLFPPAYEDDEESEDEYRRLAGGELLDGRRAALSTVAETAAGGRLSAAELDAWLRALTDLRLVLGTRLGVTEETYEREPDPADPEVYELEVFGYLSWLQEQAVAAAATGL